MTDIDHCIRLLEPKDSSNPESGEISWTLIGTLVALTFLAQAFDVYLDLRQIQMYKITEFPSNFLAAFNLHE